MRIAAFLLAILAGLSSLFLAASGYEWAAARDGGTIFCLLPAVSFVGAALAMELTALSGLLLLSLGFFWFMLGAEMHYGTNVISVTVWSFNAAAGLFAIGAWLRDGLLAASARKATRRAAADSRLQDNGLPRLGARRPSQQSASVVFAEPKRRIPQHPRSRSAARAQRSRTMAERRRTGESKACSAEPVTAAIED